MKKHVQKAENEKLENKKLEVTNTNDVDIKFGLALASTSVRHRS